RVRPSADATRAETAERFEPVSSRNVNGPCPLRATRIAMLRFSLTWNGTGARPADEAAWRTADVTRLSPKALGVGNAAILMRMGHLPSARSTVRGERLRGREAKLMDWRALVIVRNCRVMAW